MTNKTDKGNWLYCYDCEKWVRVSCPECSLSDAI